MSVPQSSQCPDTYQASVGSDATVGFRNEDLVHVDPEALNRRLDTLMSSVSRPMRTYDTTTVDGYGHAILGDVYHINMCDSKQEALLRDLQEKINALHQRYSHQYGATKQVSTNAPPEQILPLQACSLGEVSHTNSEGIAQEFLEYEHTRRFMLSTLQPRTPPNDMLQLCQSITERRRHTTYSSLEEASFLPQLRTWLSMPGSAMYILQPDLVSEDQTKDLVVHLITYFKTSRPSTVWYLTNRAAQHKLPADPQDMIKTLAMQLIDLYPYIIEPHGLQMPCTDSEWMLFFSTILSAVPECFITLEVPLSLNTWYQELLNNLKEIITDAGHNGRVLKILILASTAPNSNLFTDESCHVLHSIVRSTLTPISRSRISSANQNTSIIDKLRMAKPGAR